jgi:excisionase family DNA binding protein|tara:strand:- start:3902 stop:4483 length:582 start_codon:yes stop_codon:yes gene_type:complete
MNFLEKDVLTTGEVAKICNVAARTVSKWFDSGQIQGYRIPGSKDRRIPVANLMKFMKAHNIPFDGLMSGSTRVLICDSDSEVCSTLQRILTDEANYEVKTASSTFCAGMECERFRPHVMLVDVHMEDFDPRSLCSWIRGNEDLAGTRIVAMSSTLTDGQSAALMQQGYDSTLHKPFTVRQLIDCIEVTHAVAC